jgi:hypothetical protein
MLYTAVHGSSHLCYLHRHAQAATKLCGGVYTKLWMQSNSKVFRFVASLGWCLTLTLLLCTHTDALALPRHGRQGTFTSLNCFERFRWHIIHMSYIIKHFSIVQACRTSVALKLLPRKHPCLSLSSWSTLKRWLTEVELIQMSVRIRHHLWLRILQTDIGTQRISPCSDKLNVQSVGNLSRLQGEAS